MEKLHIGNEKSANKVVEFLPSNNINKKYNYKSDRDYSNFDWMSLYPNNFKFSFTVNSTFLICTSNKM